MYPNQYLFESRNVQSISLRVTRNTKTNLGIKQRTFKGSNLFFEKPKVNSDSPPPAPKIKVLPITEDKLKRKTSPEFRGTKEKSMVGIPLGALEMLYQLPEINLRQEEKYSSSLTNILTLASIDQKNGKPTEI